MNTRMAQEATDMMDPAWIDTATEEDLALLFPLGE